MSSKRDKKQYFVESESIPSKEDKLWYDVYFVVNPAGFRISYCSSRRIANTIARALNYYVNRKKTK